MSELTPVPEEEYKAWAQDVKDRALVNAAPAPSPKWYYKLYRLLERLHTQNRDQASVIQGLQDAYAIQASLAKKARQEQLNLAVSGACTPASDGTLESRSG